MKKLLSLTIIFLLTINSAFAACGLHNAKARKQLETRKSSVSIPDGTKKRHFKKLARVSKGEAKKIAVSKYEGKVKKAKLIDKEGALVWLLEVKGNEGQKELFIDPGNGEFLEFGLTK
jgi:uncharacterized membrane protein YkoI